MLTKKDYTTIAKIISGCTCVKPQGEKGAAKKVNKGQLIVYLSNYFELDNPRFSRGMFADECND